MSGLLDKVNAHHKQDLAEMERNLMKECKCEEKHINHKELPISQKGEKCNDQEYKLLICVIKNTERKKTLRYIAKNGWTHHQNVMLCM